MVELMMSSGMASFTVKFEVEDPLEDEHGPLTKRSKSSSASSSFNQWDAGNDEFPVPPPEYNPLDEPSPLGLRLRKSPSLLDLITMRLSQNSGSSIAPENPTSVSNTGTKGASTSVATDKLKASNFSGSLLRIGSWECLVSRLSVNNFLLANFSIRFSMHLDMKVIWWQSVTLLSISLFGKFLKVGSRVKLRFNGQISWG
uniref:Putative ovule protein n=1 Tax=Solanum chacoense TaxID=4108 RepID=A0A0V0IY93_SOLCH